MHPLERRRPQCRDFTQAMYYFQPPPFRPCSVVESGFSYPPPPLPEYYGPDSIPRARHRFHVVLLLRSFSTRHRPSVSMKRPNSCCGRRQNSCCCRHHGLKLQRVKMSTGRYRRVMGIVETITAETGLCCDSSRMVTAPFVTPSSQSWPRPGRLVRGLQKYDKNKYNM